MILLHPNRHNWSSILQTELGCQRKSSAIATTACAYGGNDLDTQCVISHRFCLSTDRSSAWRRSSGWHSMMNLIDSSHSSLNIRINYHPMNPLPSIASPVTPNIADLFTSPHLVIDSIHSLVTSLPLLQRLRSPRLQSILRLQLLPPLQPLFPIRFQVFIRILLLLFQLCWILGLPSPEPPLLRTSFQLPKLLSTDGTVCVRG